MPFSTAKFLKFRSGMQKRIGSLRTKTEDSLDCAVETMMEERVDGFFQVEHGLEEIIKSLIEIEEELEVVRDLSGAMRLESRLEFVEDRWDEFDSEIRERPRRRRKRVSLADMLKAASGSGALSEVLSPMSRRLSERRPSSSIPMPTTVIGVQSQNSAACWRPTNFSRNI
jgi:hypothetical protein